MNARLFGSAVGKFAAGFVLMIVLIFLPADTLHYPQGWLLMGILFIPMFFAGLVMMAKNPALLQSRLNAREKQREQSLVVRLSATMFFVGFCLAGLSFRHGWLMLPRWVSITGAVLFLLSYALYAEVLRENTWLSRTIEVQEGQQVVSTGLYGVVRHPMYAVTLVLFLAMPLVLGSALAFIVFLAYPFIIMKRIRNEEEVLTAELPGYAAYKQKVRWRLIPFIW